MSDKELTGQMLLDFMAKAGITWYGLKGAFGLSQSTVYRWKRVVDLDPSQPIKSQPLQVRLIRLEIAAFTRADTDIRQKGKASLFDRIRQLDDVERPKAIRSTLDRILP